MTGRRPTALPMRAARVIIGALLMACLTLPLAAQPASACDVSYGYKPSLSFDKPNLGRKPCSNGTSLAGAFIVAILAIGALGAAGTIAYKRGAATTGTSSPGQPGPGHALTGYLHATGMTPPMPRSPGQTPGPGHGPV